MTDDKPHAVASNALLAEDLLQIAESFENARGWLYRAYFFAIRTGINKTSKEIAETIKDLEKAEKQLRDFSANPSHHDGAAPAPSVDGVVLPPDSENQSERK